MHTDFPRAFTSGSRFWHPDRGQVLTSEVLSVGSLDVPTGVLIVADPSYLMDGYPPEVLPRRAPPGRWPAEVAVARMLGEAGYGTVAAMRLRFSATESVRWEPALTTESGEPAGFGVDAGRISVFDRAVLDRAVADTITTAVDTDERRPAAIVRVPVRETAELFVSDSGIGDGAYPAWWGFDGSGGITELIVEFDILLRSTFTTLTVPMDALRERGPVMTPDLLIAGVDIEVMDPEEVPGPWSQDYSSWPEHNRPVPPARPAIGLALRVRGSAYDLVLLDVDGSPVGVNPGMTGPFEDGAKIEFWADNPRLGAADTLRLSLFTGNVPLGPPPEDG